MIRTKVIQTRLMPEGRILAITLFGLVFTRDKKLIDKYILNHELIHCQQQLEWLYIPFFILYVGEWLWHLAVQMLDEDEKVDAMKAYMAISFEREAYGNDHDLDYLQKRRHYANYNGLATLRRFFRPTRMKWIALGIANVLIVFKVLWVWWGTSGQGSFETEKTELLQRRDYLAGKLVTSPGQVMDEMPSEIGPQFQGEWALYSCSMTAKALANLSILYPETKEDNLKSMAGLIEIVRSPELRRYDAARWGEDPLESLDGDRSHISYLSHLAWMISGYKSVGGDGRYDKLYDDLCSTMNRRITQSGILNIPTYPGESIYVPDMLVAIVSLHEYSKTHKGKYDNTVQQWLQKAATDWADKDTGLLVSFLGSDGLPCKDAPVKGSYSALNCYYLALIDDAFAREQYEKFKATFLKRDLLTGVKEYHDRSCWLGMDMDAGPIIFGLSPSGTAFAVGPMTYFGDADLRKAFLQTSEIAGHTVSWNGKRHYVLANLALVGESIMLAMRTTYAHDISISK